MATYVNGFGGSIVVGSTTYEVTDWTLNINAEAVDVTNTGSGGWEENILGCKSFDGSAKAFFDTNPVPTGATSNLTAGRRATFVLNVGSSGKLFSGTCQLTQVSAENPVKGAVAFNLTFKGSSSLTYAS